MERIEADLLIPGTGEPIRDGLVVLEGPTITYAGPAADAPPTPQAPSTRAAAVLPGLWDCHGHLLGTRSLDLGRLPLEPLALRAARCAADLRAALDAGVTSVREVGGLGVYLARAIEEGTLDGPTIYGAGAILSVTGGHGDLHSLPLSWVADFGQRDGELRLCDGVDSCIQAVREQLRHNAKLIKVCASGGVLSELDDPIHQQFTLAELRALDEEACAAMRETGAILVPTRTILQEMLDSTAVPPYAVRKLEVIGDRHAKAVALAHEQGVTIAMGTDIALSGAELIDSWGRNGRELPLMVESGLTPLEAIQAATFNGPLTLGRQAPRSGQLAEGYDADLIIVDGDPLADITILADPAHIVGVWKAGRRVKGPRLDSDLTEHSSSVGEPITT